MSKPCNKLYYGDNLPVMRKMKDELVDLIYLDPPFNSKRGYNVFFNDPAKEKSQAQLTAFEDTWRWTDKTQEEYEDLIGGKNETIAEIIGAFKTFMGQGQMMAYLVMMCSRLNEMHRILKDTGSIYLHCDPTASHYIKILMDGIFEPKNFINEVVWCYRKWSNIAMHFQKNHDTILVYARNFGNHTFNKLNDPDAIASHYEKGWHTNTIRGGESQLIVYDRGKAAQKIKTGKYDKIIYREGIEEVGLKDWWVISILNSQSKERLGYPTQKPIALLDRIIQASSNEGDLVFDPFCGCGTTIYSSIKNNRKWMGCDVTHLSITMMENRFKEAYGGTIKYKVIGSPQDLEGAKDLALRDRYEFEYWACGLIGVQPSNDKKKGADGGYDGFLNGGKDGNEKTLVEIKSGKNVGVSMIRSLIAVVKREKAKIGVLITLYPPTKEMKKEAVGAGSYTSDFTGLKYRKIQIFTINELFEDKLPSMPPVFHQEKTKRESNIYKHPQGEIFNGA